METIDKSPNPGKTNETKRPTVPDEHGAFRGEKRAKGWRRISHGLQLTLGEGDEFAEWLRELFAWLLVLPTGAVFTHLTGAALRGWDRPRMPDDVPVFAAVRGTTKHPRRPGLICARLRHAAESVRKHGLPVDSPEEILLRCAWDLGVLDLLIMINSALRLGDLDAARMEALLDSKRPGVRRLRQAWRMAEPKVESAGETVLGTFLRVCEVPVEAQAKLFDDEGQFVARADFRIVGTPHLCEYDGGHHRDGKQQRRDLRRDRRLSGSSYVRAGYTLDDLLNKASSTMHELDRRLGRPHDRERLRRWQRLVDHSMYTEATRTRMMNRWRRLSGVVEWSRSG